MSLRVIISVLLLVVAGLAMTAAAPAPAFSAEAPAPAAPASAALSPDAINAASLDGVPAILAPPLARPAASTPANATAQPAQPIAQAALVKLEILLDRAGASPGVIDGFDGENVRKAVGAYEIMQGQQPDGIASPQLLATLDVASPVIGSYTIVAGDTANLVPSIPTDYGEMAKLKWLGYTSVAEELAERFHMDVGLLKSLNPGAKFVPGESIAAAIVGPDKQGVVTLIQADKAMRQVRAYDAQGKLLAAYPATIGSEDTPSPSGSPTVVHVVRNPTYTYNPKLNFKQGSNDQVLTIPPGPNGPVGDVWIGLSTPTYGIHGTPEPSLIDKTASHGCVRLTNWDAGELAGMVSTGVRVDFLS